MYNAIEDVVLVEQIALSPTNMEEINEIIAELQGDVRDCAIPETNTEILEEDRVNDVIASLQDDCDTFFPMNNETSEANQVTVAGESHGIQQSSLSKELILNNSLLAEPKLSASTTVWSSMLQEFGKGNPCMNVKNPLIKSWTSPGSAPSSSSQSIGLSSGITESVNAHCPKIIPTRGVFALAPDHAVNKTAPGQFGPIVPGHVQPPSSSWNQMAHFIGNAPTRASGILGQNLFGYKRDRMSAFGLPSPATRGMPQRFDPPSVLPSGPMEHQPDYVQTWEGNISGILQNCAISFMEARAYKKVTALATLTVGWPQLLQINRTIRKSIVNNSMNTYRGPIDYVIFEILGSSDDIHDCLRSRDSCAKLDLPSQTLLLSSTNEGNRFIGTVLQGKHDFISLQFTYGSSSRGAKALRFKR